MMAAFTPAERAKLIGILSRLGSDFDGERSAAALLANRMVQARGLQWSDVVGGAPASSPPHDRQSHHPRSNDDLAVCLRHLGAVTEWEAGFVRSLQRRPKRSARQSEILHGIAADLRRRGHA